MKFFINHLEKKEMLRKVREAGDDPPHDAFGFYVPATSIRGPFRAHAERILRSLMPDKVPSHLTACDPFEQDKENHSQTLGCSRRLEKMGDNQGKYAAACPACKLFGCAGLASRISFDDADIKPGYRHAYRDMIGIDRFTGGVYQGKGNDGGGGGAKMRLHVLENTTFETTITLINFELWQLGWLAYVFRDFEEGLVPLGFGKSKGFGRMKGNLKGITLTYPAACARLEHIGSLMAEDDEAVNYYGFHAYGAPALSHLMELKSDDPLCLYHRHKITNIRAFWAAAAPAFRDYLEVLKSTEEKEVGKEEGP